MPGPQGGAGWGTEVLGSSPGPCGQSPGPRTRVWDAARAAAAGQAVSTGSREWAAGPLVGVRAACGCPVASQHRAPFPSRPRRSLAGTGHARGPELHPRPWLPRQGGGGRGLRDHPASNRKTRPSPDRGLGAALPAQGVVGLGAPSPRKRSGKREEAGSAPGAGASCGRWHLWPQPRWGGERGSGCRSASRPRSGVHLMDSAAREVAPRPLSPPRGSSPPHEPRSWGADPPRLLGLELRFWVNNGRCTNRY